MLTVLLLTNAVQKKKLLTLVYLGYKITRLELLQIV